MGKEIVTCGVFIYSTVNEKLLIVQSTGNKLYSIPKGHFEEVDNNYLTAAIREVYEETGFQFPHDAEFYELELQKYNNKNKFLKSYLYICNEDLNDFNYVCNSFFEQKGTKELLPEICCIRLVNLNEADVLLHYTQTRLINEIKDILKGK